MHTAAERGRTDLARLLGRGTDIDALGFKYYAVKSRADEAGSALHSAVDGSSVEIVELFLEHGADAVFKDVKGTTAVQRAKEKGMQRIVQILHNFASESWRAAVTSAVFSLRSNSTFKKLKVQKVFIRSHTDVVSTLGDRIIMSESSKSFRRCSGSCPADIVPTPKLP